MKEWCVYIATNKPNGVLYIGKTGNVLVRGFQHAEGVGANFTKRYNCTMIVYVEHYPTEYEATRRENN